jgi:tetratricopeptide (TPR) repeat protein
MHDEGEVRRYLTPMTFDPHALDPPAVHAIDARASRLMKRGIRLLNEADTGAVREALSCFDQALELRRRLPIEKVPVLRYGLAACWLNRADALMRLGDPDQIVTSVQACDAALELLRDLPLADDPRFPRRLAIAHHNRGLALQALGRSAVPAALAALTDAIAVLEHHQTALIDDRQYLLAAVWMNLASVRASEDTVESDVLARSAALRVMALVAELEGQNVDAAEVGLKARHVLCQALARRLSPNGGTIHDDVHEATDLVDDGLALVRRWEQKSTARFRGVACDLFRFGARVYKMHQPQFLSEFVRENADSALSSRDYVDSAEMRTATREALGLSSRQGD